MASGPEPGALVTLSVPLAAGVLTAALAAVGGDEAAFRAINAWPAVTGDTLWASVTALGQGAAVFGLSGGLAGRRPRLHLAAALAALLTLATLHPLKDLVDEARPVAVLGRGAVHVVGAELMRRSFPSGHACATFAAAALVCVGLLRGVAARTAVLALATLIALSRVAVGAHWPMDVLAGAALGWTCGCLALRLALRRPTEPRRGLQILIAVLTLLAAASVAVPDTEAPGFEPVRAALAAVGLLLGGLGLRRLCSQRHDSPVRSH
jgi:membrane-associated phospholipid phosphatase